MTKTYVFIGRIMQLPPPLVGVFNFIKFTTTQKKERTSNARSSGSIKPTIYLFTVLAVCIFELGFSDLLNLRLSIISDIPSES